VSAPHGRGVDTFLMRERKLMGKRKTKNAGEKVDVQRDLARERFESLVARMLAIRAIRDGDGNDRVTNDKRQSRTKTPNSQ
jgi:uncharacterized protein (DUF2141 family)